MTEPHHDPRRLARPPALRRTMRRRRGTRAFAAALTAVAAAIAGLPALAQTGQTGQAPTAPPLKPSPDLAPPPRGDASRVLPIVLRARQVSGQPDLLTTAEGDVELRRGALQINADRLTYDAPSDLARATGNVRVRRDGNVYSGPELQLTLQRFEGFFLSPRFEFLRLGAGGSAERVDFLDSARAVARDARYTSCPRDGSGDPDWVLETRRVRMDFDANEGIAEGAVLRFLGVPILALPVLSFPLTDARKSGWLPPSFNLDNRSGLEVSVPYYWNIAPNRDATITPRVITRRGLGVAGEFRYLEPAYAGTVDAELLPGDRVADRTRGAFGWEHRGALLGGALRVETEVDRVSDDDWWRDFPNTGRALTPRLLPQRVTAESSFALAGGRATAYARVQQWQVLQGSADLITPPYERSPQLGVAGGALAGAGVEWSFEAEANRFTLPRRATADDARSEGRRVHLAAALARPWREPGWWVVPRLSVNAASYRTDRPMADGRRSASRTVPSFSLDTGIELERELRGFGRALRQTLEPRLHYVNTPFRDQAGLPNFDSAEREFNANSIFADSSFTGIDRISDSHQITGGVTSRVLDAASGAELLRLGVVQRVLLRTQRITPDGQPLEQRFSDLLLVAGSSLIPRWTLDASLQYSPDIDRTVRSVLTARYAPGEFRTLSTTYRYTRGAAEQMEVGWQWPIGAAGAARQQLGAVGAPAAGGCGSTWYTVGRINYNLRERRITDSVIGFEFDAGCWIARVVAERLSTGRSEATTRLLLQLELVGLSRLGSNPLKVLKDNIPGYRLLRDEVRSTPDAPIYD